MAAPGDGLAAEDALQAYPQGRIDVIGPDGNSYPAGTGPPSVTVRIVDPAVILRFLIDC